MSSSIYICHITKTFVVRQKFLSKLMTTFCNKKNINAKRQVPIDLFPTNSNRLDEKWAFQTFRYYNAFHVEHKSDLPTMQDYKKWIMAGKNIIEDLKGLGVSKANEKNCDMMNTFFVFDKKNRSFCSLNDVVDFISTPKFYEENTILCRNMIHMFQYGIFRVGFNEWALQAAEDWMNMRNITYENEGKRPKGKGFVYKLIVSRACNSICDRLQAFCRRNFNEYV